MIVVAVHVAIRTANAASYRLHYMLTKGCLFVYMTLTHFSKCGHFHSCVQTKIVMNQIKAV